MPKMVTPEPLLMSPKDIAEMIVERLGARGIPRERIAEVEFVIGDSGVYRNAVPPPKRLERAVVRFVPEQAKRKR